MKKKILLLIFLTSASIVYSDQQKKEEAMNKIPENLKALLELSLRAPSSHNAQMWKIKYKGSMTIEIFIDDKKVEINKPVDAINNGIAFVTEDRKATGIFPELSVKDNMIMPNINHYLRHLLLNFKKINSDCHDQRKAISIKTPTIEQSIKNLSGGNQQKVLISRWLLTTPAVLILDEPTRGIDVGAKSEIHRLIGELAKLGKSIIMVSSEMGEILSMSDRIIVMHEGAYSGELSREEATQEKLLQLATGESL